MEMHFRWLDFPIPSEMIEESPYADIRYLVGFCACEYGVFTLWQHPYKSFTSLELPVGSKSQAFLWVCTSKGALLQDAEWSDDWDVVAKSAFRIIEKYPYYASMHYAPIVSTLSKIYPVLSESMREEVQALEAIYNL